MMQDSAARRRSGRDALDAKHTRLPRSRPSYPRERADGRPLPWSLRQILWGRERWEHDVRQVVLGAGGPAVSALCLGTMTWGNQTPEAEAHAQIERAAAAGVTFMDTAAM